MSSPQPNTQGFVSLFTCIMISLLLLVVTISLISLEALQLRKAEDAEQTLRAYYTAEAGIEDAVSKVLKMTPPYVDQACVPKPNYDATGAAGWTCQQISFSGSPKGKLDKADEAKTVDPGSTTPHYQSVVFEWNQSPVSGGAPYTVNGPFGGAGFPTQAAYGAAYAAPPLELAIVEYPDGGFAAGDPGLKLQNAVIVPRGLGSTGIVNYGSLVNHGPWQGKCGALGWVNPIGNSAYNCYAAVTGLNAAGNTDYLFRIRSRYLPTDFRMTFYTGAPGSTVVKVPDGTATIDVTAKAGQTYRRVISKLPLSNGAAAGLNYVMYSDTDVCKNFEVIDNVAQPGCPY